MLKSQIYTIQMYTMQIYNKCYKWTFVVAFFFSLNSKPEFWPTISWYNELALYLYCIHLLNLHCINLLWIFLLVKKSWGLSNNSTLCCLISDLCLEFDFKWSFFFMVLFVTVSKEMEADLETETCIHHFKCTFEEFRCKSLQMPFDIFF